VSVSVASLGIPIVIAVLALVVLVVAAVLVARAIRSAPDRTAPPDAPPGGFACPFCKRPYDPAQTGGRCPGCGAAAPRRR